MITTELIPGSPCWMDLGAPDAKVGRDFYGSVLGWELEPFEPGDDSGYGLFRKDGKAVGALGPLTEEGARPAWMIYFRAPDAKATAAEVERLGGALRTEPVDAEGAGTLVQATDALGAEFALWQPGEMPGFELTDQAGSLCWVELYTTDAAAAKEFYGALFGWTTEDMEMPDGGGTYSILVPGGQSQERMHGGLMELSAEALPQTGGKPYWHPVFAVDDCDAAVARVTASGGAVTMGPEDAEDIGRMAVCTDPFGADFVLLQPAETS